MKLVDILRNARRATYATLAVGALACTGCASYQKGVDYVFYPLHQVARQVDGESEANIYNQAASLVSNNPKYEQAAKEVPGIVTAGDILLEPAKIYGAIKAAQGNGGSTESSGAASSSDGGGIGGGSR